MQYIPFTEEEKQLANSVDLAEFLRMRGEKLERAGREYKLIYSDGSGSHDSITIHDSIIKNVKIKTAMHLKTWRFQ